MRRKKTQFKKPPVLKNSQPVTVVITINGHLNNSGMGFAIIPGMLDNLIRVGNFFDSYLINRLEPKSTPWRFFFSRFEGKIFASERDAGKL